jgi:threonine dehydratase
VVTPGTIRSVNDPTGDLTTLLDEAAIRLAPVLEPTPLVRSARLSGHFGRDVYLKREDLQPVRSYKLRGAFNMVAAHFAPGGSRLSPGAPSVVCASAGNHAQGVAWTCARLEVPATVVLPARTPKQKRDRIAALGGRWVTIELVAGVFDDAAARAGAIAEATGALLVPAFDHPLVVAGQSTLAAEIVAQLPSQLTAPPTLVLPVGGGGVAAGCVAYLSSQPSVFSGLVLAEPAGAASLLAARRAGAPVRLEEIDTFVDGAATRQVGDLPFALLREPAGPLPLPVVAVPEGAVAAAMIDLYTHEGIVAEPAGALAVAALEHVPGDSPVVALVSGGNNDLSRYGEVVERAMRHRGLRHYFLVEFPQVPGALRRFLNDVLAPTDDIVLFEYVKRSERETGPALVGIDVAAPADLDQLLQRLNHSPVEFTLLDPDSSLSRFLL